MRFSKRNISSGPSPSSAGALASPLEAVRRAPSAVNKQFIAGYGLEVIEQTLQRIGLLHYLTSYLYNDK